jgi:hypothetical protein
LTVVNASVESPTLGSVRVACLSQLSVEDGDNTVWIPPDQARCKVGTMLAGLSTEVLTLKIDILRV